MSGQAGKICIGCVVESGGDSTGIIVAFLGVAISLVSAAVSVWAVRRSSNNHDALILREEFQQHRIDIEANLKILNGNLEALELSVGPRLPISRVEANFAQAQADTEFAALAIIRQSELVDQRALFKGEWEATLRPIYIKMERAWTEVDRTGHPEGLRRAAAVQVVDAIRAFEAETRRLVEGGVRAPLVKKRWW